MSKKGKGKPQKREAGPPPEPKRKTRAHASPSQPTEPAIVDKPPTETKGSTTRTSSEPPPETPPDTKETIARTTIKAYIQTLREILQTAKTETCYLWLM